MKKYLKRIILLIITLIFLYFVFVNLDIKELCGVIKQFNLVYLPLLAVSIILSMSIRGIVFKLLMHNTAELPVLESAHLCITSSALNILLPARAGDIFRAYYTGQKYNADKIKVFGTIMFERVFDISAVFTMLAAGIFLYHRNAAAMNLCIFAGACTAIGIIAAVYAYKYNKTDEICRFIINKTEKFPASGFIKKLVSFANNSCNSFLSGFEIIKSPGYMLAALAASFTLWFFECLNYYIVICGFGCEAHWSITLFLMGFIALACMVPSSSIFIGPYQMAVIAAFSMYGINKETALAASIVDQTVVIITSSIAALIFLIKNNISYKELQKDIENETPEGDSKNAGI